MIKMIDTVHILMNCVRFINHFKNTVKTLNSGHPRFLKNLPVIKRCPLLGVSLTKINTFGTKHFARYSRHARYLGCPLLGGFTVHCARLIEGLRAHAWSPV